MADTKITALNDLPTPVGADLFAMVDDVVGTPETKKATLTNVEAALTHDNLISGTIADHDTSATGAELDTLTDGSNSDALHIHEGTAIMSTGEGGGTKFLREDGDNTCSWQTPAGAGDVTAAVNLTANTIVQGDDGAKGVKTSTATVAQIAANVAHAAGDGSDHADVVTNSAKVTNATHTGDVTGATALTIAANVVDDTHIDWGTGANQVSADDVPDGATNAIITLTQETNFGTAYTHSQDNTQAHSDYLLNSGTDIAVGPITITADNSTADQAYVPMVLYNTDATPPAASGFPIGTLYVQYTA